MTCPEVEDLPSFMLGTAGSLHDVFCSSRAAGITLCMCVLQALQGVRAGQQGVQVALAALLLLHAAQLGQGTPVLSWNTAVASLGAVGALAIQAGLASLEKKFTYENYDHAK